MKLRFVHIPGTSGSALREDWRPKLSEYRAHSVPKPWVDEYRYTIVRHPVTRVQRIYRMWRNLRDGDVPEFNAWIRSGMACPEIQKRVDFTWPCYVWAACCDYVVRMEHREEDFVALCAMLGRPMPRTHNNEIDDGHEGVEYEPDTLAFVRRRYEIDIGMWYPEELAA